MTTGIMSNYYSEGFDSNNNKHTKFNNYDNYKKTGFKADRIEQAEREMYHDLFYTTNPGHTNTEAFGDLSAETQSYHKPAEPFDHNSYLLDQVVDDRIKKNHFAWVDEVTPWAATASIVNLGEFSAGDYIHYQGLRRPRGVTQDNPWQITEVDEYDLKDNKPFTI